MSAIRVLGHGHCPSFGEALLVDVDDGDRPDGLDPGIDALERIEHPDAQLLDRGGIDDAQYRKADQKGKADQPRIANAPLEPPPQDFRSFHAVWISRLGGTGTRGLSGRVARKRNHAVPLPPGGRMKSLALRPPVETPWDDA